MLSLKPDFPVFTLPYNGKPLVYLDTASSAQKPQVVLDAEQQLLTTHYANVHRGLYPNAQTTTAAYENARSTVAQFINAHPTEIIFTRNTTEGINLVASTWGVENIKAGDEILITAMEHHANIVPWHLLQTRTGCKVLVAGLTPSGELDIIDFTAKLSTRTKLVALAHVSNVLGTINPVAEITRLAHAAGAKVLIDGSQAVMHMQVDIKELNADFYTFTGHKLYGPTGIGVLFGNAELLEKMPPYQGGGEMIKTVGFTHSTFADSPARFEAGTPHISGAIGLAAAVNYVQKIGLENIHAHEQTLFAELMESLKTINGITFYGTAAHKAPVAAFTINGYNAADIATLLGEQNVCLRAGHHCTMPLHQWLGVPATLRASLGVYSDKADITHFTQSLQKALKMLG